jgi:hypothetical protein
MQRKPRTPLEKHKRGIEQDFSFSLPALLKAISVGCKIVSGTQEFCTEPRMVSMNWQALSNMNYCVPVPVPVHS